MVKIRLNRAWDPEGAETAPSQPSQRSQTFFERAYSGGFAAPIDEVRKLFEGFVRVGHGLYDGRDEGAELRDIFEWVESGVQRRGSQTPCLIRWLDLRLALRCCTPRNRA
jgi:hypothetical protein